MAMVSVRSVGGRYLTRIEGEGHALVADEPAPLGDDLGPSPYELLLAAEGELARLIASTSEVPKGVLPPTDARARAAARCPS